MSLLIKNARLIDAFYDKKGCLGVRGEKIDYIGDSPQNNYDIIIDAQGKTVFPALVDMHCHLRDPGQTQKESLESGMRAALKGGFCTLVAMANTTPVLSSPALIKANLDKAEKLNLCRLIQVAACGEGLDDEVPTDRKALRKVTSVFSNDGKTIFSDSFMHKLLCDSKELDFLISTHCQPEEEIVARDLNLLAQTGGNLHIGHISTAKTLEHIRLAKARGLKLTCEVTPHHLLGYDCDYRVNPPLANKSDVSALIEGIRSNLIDCLATDHAPHTSADKEADMAGISNIEYALQVYLRVFYKNDIPLTRLAQMTSFNPCRRLGIEGGKLAVGCDADIIIVDTQKEVILDKAKMISRSNNTPFDGYALRGLVEKTIIKGKIRYDNGQFI